MALLHEYRDIFAWNYTEMPGLDPRVAVHKLAVHPSVRPVKQSQRRFRPELVPEIEKVVDKLIAVNFIREVKYPSWIANIVPVKKKTGQIRVCVDLRDLNKACPKDDFPLPITELMVDATTANQIRMDPKDEELTAFRTPKGIFCYKVMSFGLKNVGATCQRAMQNIFDDFLHKRVECYVDDLALANFLADHPVPAEWELTEDFPDEEIFLVEVFPPWEMYFDGVARRNGVGTGVLFVSPKKDLLPYSFALTQTCSNNEAEYQALLLGLNIAVEMQLSQLNIYGDSALVIKQLTGEFEVKKPELTPFWRHAGELLAQIPETSLHHVPRSENGPADALAGIVASLAHFDQWPNQIPIC
ncbi:hypothetical protein H6P81_007305 [Aristolochia fimbriata]|uniref:RNase H type-1 domain-containing protein n=1 Tax=Aristolochia fimbriata TaxID=158543 RepID=A0AAV7F106_ARIFI|nr:hypothetical protein H6P81_007305 [Aristolochia fimbriata]